MWTVGKNQPASITGATNSSDLAGYVGFMVILFAIGYRIWMNQKTADQKISNLQRLLLKNPPRSEGALQHDTMEAFGAIASATAIRALLRHRDDRRGLLLDYSKGAVHLEWNGVWFQMKNRYFSMQKKGYWGLIIFNALMIPACLTFFLIALYQYINNLVGILGPLMWGSLAGMLLWAVRAYVLDVAGYYAAERVAQRGPTPGSQRISRQP
ncbi:hypothetical protein RMR16_024675 (plasmid) [Agrobacterium sp. rho-13.3]|uniref:hypothetical protein n=1 Tax=Agrobacterium sp. rho-13.3 TaxID=3072980 RepID=UPI002A0E0281|nr:hypothetical protein [Agrobacterium sp. rho-13.3]MDX8310147.1 hypothetical protein [Agrobacterium sp. rho-13.3]